MNAMTLHANHDQGRRLRADCAVWMLLLVGVLLAQPVAALTLSVVDANNASIPGGYRWLIEEDTTYRIVPGQTCQSGQEADCLSVNFHKSYMPVVAEGRSGDPLPTDLDPAKRYFVSVLPDAGYGMGGAQLTGGQQQVTVSVNAQPVPTAQIRIFVFHDHWPINNAPDTPEETGLGGFNILLEDAGGRYGHSGQQITTDAFGNPLGTTYDAAGNVLALGDGTITTDANGIAVIKNLAPAKYGIQAVPPAGQGWSQTSTIEGKKIIDAWVKANEPPFFTEFGPPGPHVFIGFVKSFQDATVLRGGATLTGQVRSIHNSRPPEFSFHTGAPVPGCWVGLNDLAVGIGRGVHAAPCNEDSTFSIPNVPAGNYQLVIWDKNLDYIFGSMGVTVDAGAASCNNGKSCNLLDVPVFGWFGRLEQHVFNDLDEDGFWDAGEPPMFEQATNIRWRDGTIYQSFPTDLSGVAPYDEVFPFFSWLVAEVDYARFKATGATIVVDAGGPIDPNDPWTFGGVLNPQPQAENGGQPYRTETGPVLTQAFQSFLGQTNVILWGKRPYVPGENGGISGIVYYAVTRAENDPAQAGAELWEPGIPRIQVALYEDNLPAGGDGVIDDKNGDGCPTPADVDNHPFGNFPGQEDFDYPALDAGAQCAPIAASENGVFDAGDAVQIVTTDSWDDNVPTGCQGELFMVNGTVPTDCYDGLRNFNQVRPGVFDGGYAFTTYVPGGIVSGNAEETLPRGIYIVGTGEHPVYKTVREEDRNVDFGDEYVPAPQLLPPACVGAPHLVANEFSLFPLYDDNGQPVAPFRAGTPAPLCDRKQVMLTDGKNAAADFFLHTLVPTAAHVVGFILDDLSNEFDPNAPTFGEKYSPPYLPVSIRDWTGREIGRTYSDRWGTFNALLPSTHTTNLPTASGMAPNMLTTCMNDPGPIPDGAGGFMTDPHYNRQYSQFCYTFQYMPGATTYLDTPVVPVAAFAGPNQSPLDCQVPSGTPVIWSVIGSMNGPYVDQPGQTLTITSAVDPGGRDYGFGNDPGTVTIGGVPLQDVSWSTGAISGTVAPGTVTGQLEVIRADGAATSTGLTVTVGGGAIQVAPAGSIQAAIDLANPGDLVLVPPGEFEELVILWKPLRLQGAGAATVINAIKAPAEKLANWRLAIEALHGQSRFDLLPAQEVGFDVAGEPATLFTEEGPGIIVLGLASGRDTFARHAARIDGLSITGADHAGGIVVNGYATNLEISNNRIFGNHGIYGGGVRVGHPALVAETATGLAYQDGFNDNIRIHHNHIAENGGGGGAGGGVSLYHGSDNYAVTRNTICGNYSQGEGAGIGHYGLSNNGLLAYNRVLFNQSFNQGQSVSGGGLFIGGAPSLAANGLSPGSGSVRVDANLIQGNQAGAGDGGGIRAAFVNGNDVALNRNIATRWHRLEIVNNLIVNNMAGLAGGGISLQDVARSTISNNTVVHNDATATAGEAFAPGSPNRSTAQPAGIVSRAHSAALQASFGNQTRAAYGAFSKPALFNNIVWRNRSFYFQIDDTGDVPVYGLMARSPLYWDLAVLGATGRLNPRYCLLTATAGYHASNRNGGGLTPNDLFQFAYVNTGNGETLQQVELTTSIAAQPAFDEGGNFIDVRFGPLAPTGDYHLAPGAMAVNAGTTSGISTADFDGQVRPQGVGVDIGADEAE